MSLICNVQIEITGEPGGNSAQWSSVYESNEEYIESGSAFFSQAFAEALALVSDLELHDVGRAWLRLEAISALLSDALEQYEASVELDSQTGLGDYHEARLREVGVNFDGFRRTLAEARSQDLVAISDERIDSIARILDDHGYAQLLGVYIDRVRDIRSLVAPRPLAFKPGDTIDAVVWQELGWKLTTRFARAIEIGQAIAILNTFMLRTLQD